MRNSGFGTSREEGIAGRRNSTWLGGGGEWITVGSSRCPARLEAGWQWAVKVESAESGESWAAKEASARVSVRSLRLF